jgi:hypothetical protein
MGEAGVKNACHNIVEGGKAVVEGWVRIALYGSAWRLMIMSDGKSIAVEFR